MEVFPFAADEPSPDLLPVAELADCAATVLARDGKAILSYGPGAGYSPLRELIADWFGIRPYNVVLTNGWLQGLAFITEELLRGRSAAVESPSDGRLLASLLASGSSLIYISSDSEGMITTELEQQLVQYLRPTMICLNAGFGSPTGAAMSLARRRHLLEVLGNFDRLGGEKLHLLEDDSFALTRFDGQRTPALFDLSGGTTLYSSSFSASIAPGLRVGWLIVPNDLVQRIGERASSTYISPGLLGQATVHEFISRGALEPHLGRLREALRARRDAMVGALADHFPEASWSHPQGGYYVWLQLPEPLDGREVLAAADGVTAAGGTEFGVTSRFLRLTFAAVPADEIPEGIARLARAAHALLEGRAA